MPKRSRLGQWRALALAIVVVAAFTWIGLQLWRKKVWWDTTIERVNLSGAVVGELSTNALPCNTNGFLFFGSLSLSWPAQTLQAHGALPLDTGGTGSPSPASHQFILKINGNDAELDDTTSGESWTGHSTVSTAAPDEHGNDLTRGTLHGTLVSSHGGSINADGTWACHP